jgi:YfiH family protein
VLSWPALESAGADAIVTTRGGGVSPAPYASLNLGLHVGDDPGLVLENRRRAAAALGADPGDVVWAAQPHGRVAAVVTAADRGRGARTGPGADPGGALAVPDTDALVTAEPGPVLAILVADCVPIVLYDPAAQVLACVHAGWRGTVARITSAALTAMAGLGARPARVLAGIGPGIGPDRYQVGGDVAGPAREALGAGADRVLWPDGTGRWRFDLPTANALLLAAAGVPAGQIYQAAQQTGGDGPFFSHRDSQPGGRFALLARLQPGGRT